MDATGVARQYESPLKMRKPLKLKQKQALENMYAERQSETPIIQNLKATLIHV